MSRLLHLSLPCLTLCAAPALAQVGSPPMVPSDIGHYVVPWPDGIPGSFLCIEPGDYDCNGTPDAAVLRGTKPVILLDPAIFGASLVLPCNVNDIARLAHGGLNGEDVLATVDAGGLTLWDFDPLEENEPRSFTPRSVGTATWAGALQVVGGDVDGDLDEDLLGLGADGRTILRLQNQGAGSLVSLASFQALAPVRQFGLVEWDGDAAPEVWALTTKALDVYEFSGVRVANNRNFSLTGQVDGVAVLRHPQPDSPTIDRIVWATKASSTSPNQILLVLYPGGYEIPIPLGDAGVVALATGDYDHDGDSDLLMSQKDLHVIRRIDNQKALNPSGRTFEGYPTSAVDYWAGSSGPNGPPNLSALPWIDWDNDAELDLMCAAEPQTWVLLYPAIGLPEPVLDTSNPNELIATGHPAFASMEYFSASSTPCQESTVNAGRLEIVVDNAWGANPYGTDVLDLVVYEQRTLDHDPCPNNVAIRHHRYPLNTVHETGKFRIPMMIPQTGGLFEGRYFCLVRVIGNVPNPRTYVGGFTSDVYDDELEIPIGSWTALMALPFGWPASIPNIFNFCLSGGGSVDGGGFRPLSRMPPFQSGYSPQPGEVRAWDDPEYQ